MKKSNIVIMIFCLGFTFNMFSQNIIPKPVSMTLKNGSLSVDSRLPIVYDKTDVNQTKIIKHLQDVFTTLGFAMQTAEMSQGPAIKLSKSSSTASKSEGYSLTVNENGINIQANDFGGFFNGLQTLRQLLPLNRQTSTVSIPYLDIEDYPRFAWRGLMLDVSRHFFSVEDVKQYIDQMVQYKYNVLHWHLTDDEGWRVEIKSLPKLTSVGAWRVERHGKFGEGRAFPKENEKATYGGFYTQDQIKDVVAYALERNVTIVPELDVPGHSMAVLAAYPELSVGKTPKFVNPGSKFSEWYGDGTFKMLIENTLDPTNEKVYEFLDKVMTEVAALFPGKYIHMGGDECYKGYWEESKSVQDFMKKNKIKDSHELQSYFVTRVEKIISSKGKNMIGWDEILEGGLAKGAAVMSWRGMKGGIEAAKLGHKVVMSPTTFAYIDYTQGDKSVETNIYADLSLEKSYEFEPLPEGVDPSLILGGQANLWTEAIPHLDYAMYMTYPRALATAESVWSPANLKSWPDFAKRVEYHFDRFDQQGVTISKAIYDPVVNVAKKESSIIVTLTSPVANTEIRYSLDNTYPLHKAAVYREPLTIPEGHLFLRTQLYRNGQPLGRLLQISREELVKRAK
jgi:hexosaminidase